MAPEPWATGRRAGKIELQVLIFILILAGSLLLTLFSYLTRLYSERGRFLIRGSRHNIEFFEEQVEPNLRVQMEQAVWAFPLLVQSTLVLIGLLVATWNLEKPFEWTTILGEAIFLLLDVLLFGLVIPNVLLSRTEGKWLRHWAGIVRTSVRLVYPVVAVGQFLHRIAMLGAGPEEELHPPAETIEALMQAGEEEGLLEKEDRKLIQSVVEFGDKTVREVMTPRQAIVAVPSRTTLSELKQMLATKRYTRIPIYEGDLDHMIGFVHSGDLFAVEEAAAERQSVQELVRLAPIVPETKLISELLPELQQKAPMAFVVDEYGSVSGLVTVEDLVEEIVGEIRDEHEPMDVISEGAGRYNIPGDLDLDRLRELFDVRLEDTGEARTVSGLVTDLLGRVPAAGERLQWDELSFLITEANGRRVLRMVVTGPVREPAKHSEPSIEAPTGGRSSGSSQPAA
jgi:CBS domain containing-hemolysin-like protein